MTTLSHKIAAEGDVPLTGTATDDLRQTQTTAGVLPALEGHTSSAVGHLPRYEFAAGWLLWF